MANTLIAFPTGNDFANQASLVSVSSGVGANVKGAWVQLIASLTNDIQGFFLELGAPSVSTNSVYAFDIGTGGAGSEVVKIANIVVMQKTAAANPLQAYIYVPFRIPASTRVAARVADSAGVGTSSFVTFQGISGVTNLNGTSDTFGVASGIGTQITAGAASTFGAWVQLSASTPNLIQWIVVNLDTPSTSGATFFVDVGTGGAGSETAVAEFTVTMFTANPTPVNFCLPVNIPASTRVSARLKYGAAGTPTFNISLIGMG